MNKSEYLVKLKKELSGLPTNYTKDILNDYDIHFSNGIENNETEEEISKRLGDVKQIAKSIITDYHIERAEKMNSAKGMFSVFAAATQFSVGTINMLTVVPFLFLVVAAVELVYIFDYILFLTPLALVAHIFFPELPINFGVNSLPQQILMSVLAVLIGILLRFALKGVNRKLYNWVIGYTRSSVKFIKNEE